MRKQKDMEHAMLLAHRRFLSGLEESLDIFENDIIDVEGIKEDCTDEWCRAREDFLDYIHKSIFSISEPRWADKEDSEKIRKLRNRVKDLYVHFKGAKA